MWFCRPKTRRVGVKKNPLKNLQVMLRLNPYAKTFRRIQLLKQLKKVEAKTSKKATKAEVKKDVQKGAKGDVKKGKDGKKKPTKAEGKKAEKKAK